MRIVAIALLFIVGPIVIESCCLRTHVSNFSVDDLSMTTIPYPSQNSNPPSVVAPVRLPDVAFRLEVKFEESMAALKSVGGFEAVACNMEAIYHQAVSSVTITSTADLAGIPAGQSLNTLFVVDYNYNGEPIETFVGAYPTSVVFRSTETVTSPQTHIFTFRIGLDDERVFEPKSVQLELIP